MATQSAAVIKGLYFGLAGYAVGSLAYSVSSSGGDEGAAAEKAAAATAAATRKAICVVRPVGTSAVHGVVDFTQPSDTAPTTMSARITGLRSGEHAFRIHRLGNTTLGHHSVGPNFGGQSEGGGGHLGEVYSSSEGVSTFRVDDAGVSLHGASSVIGRSVVISAGQSQQVAVGVIGIAE